MSALAFGELVPVPTLALNVLDNKDRSPANLYMLSLKVETEAQQIARLAWQESRRNAVIVTGSGAVQRRMKSAFSEEFTQLGGKILSEPVFSTDLVGLQSLANSNADMYFLALDYNEARTARAYLGPIPIYATSSVHAGDTGPLAGYDLADVTFVDMPWLLEPNHAAVMIYPRSKIYATVDLERLYALGIDAWRVSQLLLAGARDIFLDGVTSQLSLAPDGRFQRELSARRYVEGHPKRVAPAKRESPW